MQRVFAIGMLSLLANFSVAADPVQIQSGKVTGVDSRDESIDVFKGIPYAAPPVGDLRWRPPQPPAAWDGVRACSQYAAKSLQHKDWEKGGQSEDCLYLNVWSPRKRLSKKPPAKKPPAKKPPAKKPPAKKPPAKKRPVMVWIHGGGFTQGSGHQPGYNGMQLTKRGVVVVTINYRLGAFGFMTHPALSAESPHGSSGNYAILDQIAALKWVQDNIASFGGDPDNVTIFGESAGGTSVYLLTATPLAKGLFHRAILESPWLDPSIFRNLKSTRENGAGAELDGEQQVAKALGEGATDVLAQLRAMPAEEVMERFKQRWPVATDGWVFPKAPRQIYSDGDQHDVPTIVGTNRDEGTMFTPKEAFGGSMKSYKEAMMEHYGDQGERVAAFYAPESEQQLWKVGVQHITDSWFVQPSREFARAMESQGTPVWMYHFTKPVWGWMGAAHAAEIGYVFGNLEEPKPDDAALSDAFMDYWVQFAKTGDPNVKGQPAWAAYTRAEDRHQVMNATVETDTGLRKDACDMLDQVLKERQQQPVSAN